jgi:xylose dehydrogenase (NAD/NADP)
MSRTESKPLRIGVLGVGAMARRRFFPALESIDDLVLAAVGTRDPERLSLERNFYPNKPVAITYEELLKKGRELVDAVYIALPNDMHVSWVLECAKRDLHVLCEKPLAFRRDDARRCADAFAAKDLLLAEVSTPRFDPRNVRVAQLIASGVLGTIHVIESRLTFPLENPANIRLKPERMGGALLDIGWYGVEMSRLLYRDEPVAVTARALWGAASGVDEVTALVLLFAGGRMSSTVVSTHLRRNSEYRVCGVEATVTVPDAFVPNEIGTTTIVVEGPDNEHRVEEFPPFSPVREQLFTFAQALWTGDRTRFPVEAGVANATALEAALVSMREGPRMELQW